MFVQFIKINDVKHFVDLANECSQNISVISGNYKVNAKSILGIFSLDLDSPVEVVIDGDTTASDAKAFCEAISVFTPN